MVLFYTHICFVNLLLNIKIACFEEELTLSSSWGLVKTSEYHNRPMEASQLLTQLIWTWDRVIFWGGILIWEYASIGIVCWQACSFLINDWCGWVQPMVIGGCHPWVGGLEFYKKVGWANPEEQASKQHLLPPLLQFYCLLEFLLTSLHDGLIPGSVR